MCLPGISNACWSSVSILASMSKRMSRGITESSQAKPFESTMSRSSGCPPAGMKMRFTCFPSLRQLGVVVDSPPHLHLIGLAQRVEIDPVGMEEPNELLVGRERLVLATASRRAGEPEDDERHGQDDRGRRRSGRAPEARWNLRTIAHAHSLQRS